MLAGLANNSKERGYVTPKNTAFLTPQSVIYHVQIRQGAVWATLTYNSEFTSSSQAIALAKRFLVSNPAAHLRVVKEATYRTVLHEYKSKPKG